MAKLAYRESYPESCLQRWLPVLRDHGFVFEFARHEVRKKTGNIIPRHPETGQRFESIEDAYRWVTKNS